MLKLTIPALEHYDEAKNEFFFTKECVLQLEHSLVSLSKWESKWCKPFLKGERNHKETVDYIRCMTITQNVDDEVYLGVTDENIEQVKAYIDAPMTATVLTPTGPQPVNREIITAELIYYRMIALNVPFECQKWHLNRLLMLLSVCAVKNEPPKKMSRKEILARNASENQRRLKSLNTRG